MRKKIGIGFRVIAVFYFLIAFFYLFFGMLFTGFIFDFGSVMGGGDSYVSDFVIENSFGISGELVAVSAPVFSFLLSGDVFFVGVVMIFLSFVLFMAGLGMWRGKWFAAVFIMFFSFYEIFVVSFFLEPKVFVLIPHLITHLVILFYLLFYLFGVRGRRD